MTPGDMVAAADGNSPQQQCEALFYAGEIRRQAGNDTEARALYRAAVDVGVTIDQRNYVDRLSEFELAEWRLRQFDGRP